MLQYDRYRKLRENIHRHKLYLNNVIDLEILTNIL